MEIEDCGCGRDHETMPVDTEYDDDGNAYTYELVCRVHKRHEPCRKCIRDRYCDVEEWTQEEYRLALIADLTISEIRAVGGV